MYNKKRHYLNVLGYPAAFRAKSIYHVCIEMRRSLVYIHYCRWFYHFFINKTIAITTAERLFFLSRGILQTLPKIKHVQQKWYGIENLDKDGSLHE